MWIEDPMSLVPAEQRLPMKCLFDFSLPDFKNRPCIPLNKFRGARAFLVIPVPRYNSLTEMYYDDIMNAYSRWHQQGLCIMLAFSTEFATKQDVGYNIEDYAAAAKNRSITANLFGETQVNGRGCEPVFKWLKECLPGPLGPDVHYAFTKFLLNDEGLPIRRIHPSIPLSEASAARDIEFLLGSTRERSLPMPPKTERRGGNFGDAHFDDVIAVE